MVCIEGRDKEQGTAFCVISKGVYSPEGQGQKKGTELGLAEAYKPGRSWERI